jgi:hypothetical protein
MTEARTPEQEAEWRKESLVYRLEMEYGSAIVQSHGLVFYSASNQKELVTIFKAMHDAKVGRVLYYLPDGKSALVNTLASGKPPAVLSDWKQLGNPTTCDVAHLERIDGNIHLAVMFFNSDKTALEIGRTQTTAKLLAESKKNLEYFRKQSETAVKEAKAEERRYEELEARSKETVTLTREEVRGKLWEQLPQLLYLGIGPTSIMTPGRGRGDVVKLKFPPSLMSNPDGSAYSPTTPLEYILSGREPYLSTSRGTLHPHTSVGSVCPGNMRQMATSLMEKGDVLSMAQVVNQYRYSINWGDYQNPDWVRQSLQWWLKLLSASPSLPSTWKPGEVCLSTTGEIVSIEEFFNASLADILHTGLSCAPNHIPVKSIIKTTVSEGNKCYMCNGGKLTCPCHQAGNYCASCLQRAGDCTCQWRFTKEDREKYFFSSYENNPILVPIWVRGFVGTKKDLRLEDCIIHQSDAKGRPLLYCSRDARRAQADPLCGRRASVWVVNSEGNQSHTPSQSRLAGVPAHYNSILCTECAKEAIEGGVIEALESQFGKAIPEDWEMREPNMAIAD